MILGAGERSSLPGCIRRISYIGVKSPIIQIQAIATKYTLLVNLRWVTPINSTKINTGNTDLISMSLAPLVPILNNGSIIRTAIHTAI